jgi:hypothetical protein
MLKMMNDGRTAFPAPLVKAKDLHPSCNGDVCCRGGSDITEILGIKLVTRPVPQPRIPVSWGGICPCDGWADHELVRIHPFDNLIRPYKRPMIGKSHAIRKCG